MASFSDFLHRQWMSLPYPTQSFTGQTVIVTGSNTGLGFETAQHFARLGASKVILAVRSIAKGEEAADTIHKSIGRKGICEVWQVDVGNFNSVKDFTQKAANLDRLDVVVENAGIQNPAYVEMEGMESTIAVNVVGTFLMALGLLPTLRKSGGKHGIVPRLVIVSSDVHFWVSFPFGVSSFMETNRFKQAKMAERNESSIFEALAKNNPKYQSDRYNTSKLLEILTVRELAERMRSGPHADEQVVLNTVNPGLCHSSLSRTSTGLLGVAFFVVKFLLARTTEVGSRNFIFAADAGELSHGQYISDCGVTNTSEFVRSAEGKETQDRVFKELIAILEKLQPGITGNI
jgi:NAD(P)-dependent dehydrogenase (short-subunit alcohol dehydrogenase family)